MFKSLFSLVGQVLRLFSKEESKESYAQSHADIDEHNLEQVSEQDHSAEAFDNPFGLEVEEVEVFSDDWGGVVPQRASALFPQTLPKLEASQPDIIEDPQEIKTLSDRDIPSPEAFFDQASADLAPKLPPEKPDRPLPKSVQPDPLPVVPKAPSAIHYNTHVKVGRLVKQEPEEPKQPIQNFSREPEVIHSGKKGRRRLIQPMEQGAQWGEQDPRLVRDQRPLPPPPRATKSGFNDSLSYHDLAGERGATSRAQYNQQEPFGQVNIFSNPELPEEPINRRSLSAQVASSLADLSPPPLKPKPVRFKSGNYLRFWGNYSAQPSYLHFGSLIRSERFIELLPIWYNELDELETEAKEEWSHLEDESPLEGEADWRRLLNPTMNSPIEFLLHRDRVEQINLLPKGH